MQKRKVHETSISNALKDNSTNNNQTDDLINCEVSLQIQKKPLILNSELRIIRGKKYGFIGQNGSGKSTLLKNIVSNKIKCKSDVFYVHQEFEFDSDKSIFQIVLDANRKRMKMLNRVDELTKLLESDTSNNKILDEYNDLHEKLRQNNFEKDDALARKILFGLGFTKDKQNLNFSMFSGGWKMRVALARGLYMKPSLLLLDEPTNHLDLDSVIWLTDYLANVWKKTIIVVSHNTHFINSVCTNIIHLENQKLSQYSGNYDAYKLQYQTNLQLLQKKWTHVQNEVKGMRKKGLAKEKVDLYIKNNSHLNPPKPYIVKFNFKQPSPFKNPLLSLDDISFGYDKLLFDKININLYGGEKITIVGKNGVGKSTFINTISGQLIPHNGSVNKDQRTKIAMYNQHVADVLSPNITPIDYLTSLTTTELKEFDARKILGSIGLPGDTHLNKMETLSGGQKARVVLAGLIVLNPHIMLLDEPTNHLDIESIDSLINTINDFTGIIIMITHNIDLVQKTNSTVYELDNGKLNKIDFDDYYENVLNEID